MTHYYDNVRPLICPQVRRYRSHTSVAEVIPLYPTHRAPRHWRAVMFSLLAIVAVTAVATALLVTLRSANETMGQMIPRAWW